MTADNVSVIARSHEADVRYLLRYLNLPSYQAAVDTLMRFYPPERYPQKALYALEEILAG